MKIIADFFPKPVTIDQTRILVKAALAGKKDKSGQSLYSHALRVHGLLYRAAARPPTIEEQHIALLHDVLEDSELTDIDLTVMGYSDRVLWAVKLLTCGPDESYGDYIARILYSANPAALRVKIADQLDNTDPNRMVNLSPAFRNKLSRRYAGVLPRLQQELAKLS